MFQPTQWKYNSAAGGVLLLCFKLLHGSMYNSAARRVFLTCFNLLNGSIIVLHAGGVLLLCFELLHGSVIVLPGEFFCYSSVYALPEKYRDGCCWGPLLLYFNIIRVEILVGSEIIILLCIYVLHGDTVLAASRVLLLPIHLCTPGSCWISEV